MARNALTLVVGGAPLAVRAADVAAGLVAVGWAVRVVGSSASLGWVDADAVAALTGEPVLVDQRQADQRRGPRPDAVVACPLTMNSAAKAAVGILDIYAAGVLVDALAEKTPLTVVLTVSSRLWGHPAWDQHLRTLGRAGVRFVDPGTGTLGAPRPVESGTGADLAAAFDPGRLAAVVGSPPPPS